MLDIRRFTLADMTICGRALREMSEGVFTMQEVAERIVSYFYDEFRAEDSGERCFPLVRLFKTHPYQELPPYLRRFAADRLGHEPWMPLTKCLTLLATAGHRPEWNDITLSRDHQAIPLTSEDIVNAFPMISQLTQQLGLNVSDLINPNPDRDLVLANAQRSYKVFYEHDASSSTFITAQDGFVKTEGIKSVLGFGGVLPDGDLFAVILFSTHFIPRDIAMMFSTIALNANLGLMPFESRVFRTSLRSPETKQRGYFLTRQTVFEHLIDAQEGSILAQAERLEREGQELYRTVFDHSNDGILIVNPEEDSIVDANSKAQEMLAFNRTELIGMACSTLFPVDSVALAAFTRSVLETGKGSTDGLSCVTKSGALIPVEISASTVDIHGQRNIISIVRDISERMEAEDSAREWALTEERNRLARELHDSVSQLLYSATLFAEAGLQHVSDSDLPAVHEDLAEIQATSVQALKEMRLLLYQLNPFTLEEDGLHAALQQRIEAVERRSGVTAQLAVQLHIHVPKPIAENILGIAFEALNNSLKHAEASKVSVLLSDTDGQALELEVRDDGVGFHPDSASRGGMGLRNMRSRAADMGGSLTITSTPGAGTTIRLDVAIEEVLSLRGS